MQWVKGWDDAAPPDPDEGGGEEVAWQFVWQLGARIVPGQRNGRSMQSFEKFLIMASTGTVFLCFVRIY